MEVVQLRLNGLMLLKPKVFKDSRGFFLESYNETVYKNMGIHTPFVQDNHSWSQKDTIRGIHFQSDPGQAKLMRVASGKIFDVAVDIRKDSPTYGQWEGVVLDGEDHHQLFIPVGFAHGFCVLSENAHVIYKTSSVYNPATEMGFHWDDPAINIQWPVKNPIVSDRDRSAPLLKNVFEAK